MTILLFYLFQKICFDISDKLSPQETICKKCQSLFPGKNKKNIINLLNLPRAWLTFVLRARICPAFENSVDPDQLASEEANWSGSALCVI